MIDHIKKIIAQHSAALDLLQHDCSKLEKIALSCQKALEANKKIFFFGNGGSAADSQHLAAEFVGRFKKNRQPLPALALSVNTSSLTAIGNDFGFEKIFSRQLAALANPGDVAIGLSTSGNSPNVAEALSQARQLNLTTIAFLGRDGGEIANLVDIPLIIPVKETPRVQEIHILAGHIICELVENNLKKTSDSNHE